MRFKTSRTTLAYRFCEDAKHPRRVIASFANTTITCDQRLSQPSMANTAERKLLDPSELGTKE